MPKKHNPKPASGLNIHIDCQSFLKHIPDKKILLDFARATLFFHKIKKADIGIRIVNKKESTYFNKTYRNKNYPANVLAFDYEKTPVLSGDIILCAPLIRSPADWAHLITHALLHLMGYDHQTPREAKTMESTEILLLTQMGFDNPYV